MDSTLRQAAINAIHGRALLAKEKAWLNTVQAEWSKHFKSQLEDTPHLVHNDPEFLSICASNRGGESSTSTQSTWFLITVNPNPKGIFEDQVNAFLPKLAKAVTKKWIDRYVYTVEQRSEDENEHHGIHAHIMVERNIPKSKSAVQTEFMSTFGSMVGNKQHIDVKPITPGTELQTLLYLTGAKEKDKILKVVSDERMRSYYGIDNLYMNFELSELGYTPMICHTGEAPACSSSRAGEAEQPDSDTAPAKYSDEEDEDSEDSDSDQSSDDESDYSEY